MAKAPTRKQLAARKKFVKMVRARARAARAAKKNPKLLKTRAQKAAYKSLRKYHSKKVAKGFIKSGYGRKKNPVSVMKNGRRLYGAAAQAVLASRGKKTTKRRRNVEMGFYSGGVFHPIRASSDYSAVAAHETPSARSRGSKRGHALRGVRTRMAAAKKGRKNPRNGIFRSAARAAISRRLSAPIRFRRRRNSGTPEDIKQMHEMFLGRPTESTFEITAPAGTPKDVAVLGSLVCLKTEEEEFDFDKGEAYLGADGRGNLYVLGDTTPVETNTNFGEIEEIRYEARKDHLNPFRWRRRKTRRNSSNVEYFHYFGEEDGVMPKLKSDGDGLLHISGGNYTVEAEGIIN